jgi:hypothetical protein
MNFTNIVEGAAPIAEELPFVPIYSRRDKFEKFKDMEDSAIFMELALPIPRHAFYCTKIANELAEEAESAINWG